MEVSHLKGSHRILFTDVFFFPVEANKNKEIKGMVIKILCEQREFKVRQYKKDKHV